MLFNEIGANVVGATGVHVRGNDINDPKYCVALGEQNPIGCTPDPIGEGNGCPEPRPFIGIHSVECEKRRVYIGDDCVSEKLP